MRTTIDLPDPILRQLKSRAALEGATLKALVLGLIERGLEAPAAQPRRPGRSKLPSLNTAHALPLENPSNAALFDLLNDA